ncbi:MAG TPA: hypothetical protein VIV60_20930 [Polyangiaceae bacterium]
MNPADLSIAALITILIGACGSSGSPSPTSAKRVPTVNVFEVAPNQTRQTISHIGSGNFNHYFTGVLGVTEPISEMNLALLQPRFARVDIQLAEW